MNINDASTRSLATRLQTLHDVRAQLFRASTTDELCRRAIELGHEDLEFDRISIWLAHGMQEARGSYGIDESGTLQDERHAQIAVAPTSAMGRIFHGDTDLLIEAAGALYDETGTVIGQGTHVLAALWDGLHVVGALSADNLLSQTPYRDEDGEILRLYAVIIGHLYQQLLSEDARQQAVRQCAEIESALHDAEHDLASFFDSMPDVAVVATPQGDILYVNPAAGQLLGYSTEELAAKPILAWHPPALRGEADDIYTAMFRGEQSQCLLPLMAHDGTLIPVRTQVWLGMWHGASCVYAIIKDRREAQEAEQRFEQIFRQNPSPMAITQVEDGRFVDVNEAFLETTGYARHEVLGQTVAALQLFPDAAQRDQVRQHLQTTGHLDQVEMLVRRKDGSMRTGLFIGDRITYRELPHFLTVMVDITERKQIEHALEMQSLVLDQIQDHVTITDFVGNITYVNAAECQSMQRSREQLVGQNVITYGEDASRGATQQQIIDATLTAGTWRGEVVNYTADGREMLMDCRTQLVRDAQGQAVALCGIATDITERKQVETHLRLLVDMLDHAPNAITVHDEQGQFLYANQQTFTLHGYTADEFMRLNLHDLDVPESAALIAARIQRIQEDGAAQFEVAHYRKDQTVIPLEVLVKCVSWEGRPAFLSIATDITVVSELNRQPSPRVVTPGNTRYADGIVRLTGSSYHALSPLPIQPSHGVEATD